MIATGARVPTGAAVATVAVVSVAAGLELAARSVARVSLVALLGIDAGPATIAWIAVLVAALAIAALAVAHAAATSRVVAIVLLTALPAGLAAQLQLGARLQSDGFYYFAHMRSLWFDHDQDLTNDYRLLGLGDKPQLFVPTPTGHAPSAWTIGPAIVWTPFFWIGHLVARGLHSAGRDVAVDGTSFPYRQAICVAGLCWGLAGLYFCYLLAARFATESSAALAMALVAGGSFLIWYVIKEPTMTHAPSMAAVAVFTWGWVVTRGHRRGWQWAALGLLAGFMGTIRWQNVIFALLPAIEWLATAVPMVQGRQRASLLGHLRSGLLFFFAAVIGFVPQMLVWKAIYGHWFAVSPLGPQIRWWHPHVADVLWSSRNGLFATSPILYVGAIGLILSWRRDRLFAAAALITCAAMVVFNGSIQDWWGSAAFGGRRFDGALPLLVVGTAVAAEGAAAVVARTPLLAVAAAGALLVIWNLTFFGAALDGSVRIGEAIAFGPLAARQAESVVTRVGHPFSWPVNTLFAWRNGVSAADYDLLEGQQFLTDPTRPYGRVDVGGADEPWLGAGWNGQEKDGEIAFRWAEERAIVRFVLDHPAALKVQVRARAFSWPGAPAQQVTIRVNDTALTPLSVPDSWTVLESTAGADAWRGGFNVVTLQFAHAARPADVAATGDARRLSAAIDYVRVVEVE